MQNSWLAREREVTCRRQAIQIAAQLPDDRDEAKLVLCYVAELMGWLMPPPREDQEVAEGSVLPFPASPSPFNR